MPSFNCRHPTCPALLPRRGYCPAHQHQRAPANADRHRLYDRTKRDPEAKRFYASSAWQHARAAKLAATPWCEECRRAFLATVPRNEGEANADYFARCTAAAATIAAAGRAATVSSLPGSPETMVKMRTLDWLFDAVAVRTILLNWDQAIANLTAAGTDEASAAADQLTRTKGYMAGTGPLDGIDVSDPGVRAKVASMVETTPPVLTQAQANAINALGTVTTYAVAADLSEQQVTDEIAAMAAEANRASLLAEADRRYQLAYDGIGDRTLTTLDQVKAVLGGA